MLHGSALLLCDACSTCMHCLTHACKCRVVAQFHLSGVHSLRDSQAHFNGRMAWGDLYTALSGVSDKVNLAGTFQAQLFNMSTQMTIMLLIWRQSAMIVIYYLGESPFRMKTQQLNMGSFLWTWVDLATWQWQQLSTSVQYAQTHTVVAE